METTETTIERREKLYVRLASLINAYKSCIKTGNTEWKGKHFTSLQVLVKAHMPCGSGFDNGTKIDLDLSTEEKIMFRTSFHHMNEDGYYDGWTEHTIKVVPSLWCGFHIMISGRDLNGIKEYIAEAFDQTLRQEIVVK